MRPFVLPPFLVAACGACSLGFAPVGFSDCPSRPWPPLGPTRSCCGFSRRPPQLVSAPAFSPAALGRRAPPGKLLSAVCFQVSPIYQVLRYILSLFPARGWRRPAVPFAIFRYPFLRSRRHVRPSTMDGRTELLQFPDKEEQADLQHRMWGPGAWV